MSKGPENKDPKPPVSGPKIDPKPPISGPKIDPKQALQKTLGPLSRSGFAQQFVAGTAAGWISGYMASRLGRTVALVAGASILGVTIAQHQGLLNQTHVKGWADQAKLKYGQQAPNYVAKVKGFAQKNRVFAAGFTGGFLIGMAY